MVPSRHVSWTMGPSQQPVPSSSGGALWPGMYHSPVTAALWQARASIREKDGRNGERGEAPTEVITRTPSMSRTSVSYGLAGDAILREQYRNPWNGCRIGKLLEDLDALAGTIAMKVWSGFGLGISLSVMLDPCCLGNLGLFWLFADEFVLNCNGMWKLHITLAESFCEFALGISKDWGLSLPDRGNFFKLMRGIFGGQRLPCCAILQFFWSANLV